MIFRIANSAAKLSRCDRTLEKGQVRCYPMNNVYTGNSHAQKEGIDMKDPRSDVPKKIILIRIVGGTMLVLFGISFGFFYESLLQKYKIIWIFPLFGGLVTYKSKQYPMKKNIWLAVFLGVILYAMIHRILWLMIS